MTDVDMKKKLVGPEIMRETYVELLNRISHVLDHCLDGNPPRLSMLDKVLIACGTYVKIRLA